MIPQAMPQVMPQVTQQLKPEERRLSRRKIPENLTYIGLPMNNGGIVLDISEGGLGFHSIAPIVADGPIAFRFSVDSAKRVKAMGELAWIDDTGTTGGLRFTELPDEIRESIRTWSGQPQMAIHAIPVAQPAIHAELANHTELAIHAELAAGEAAGKAAAVGPAIGPAADFSIAEPQPGAAISISSEFSLVPYLHTPDDELEMESAAEPLTEADLGSDGNVFLIPTEVAWETEFVVTPITEADLATGENLPSIPPEIEWEAALAKQADFSPEAARSNPVLYNFEPPVYSSPSYSLSMFPPTPYSAPENNLALFSRPGTIKHPIAAIALTAVFAFITAVGIFSYMSTTLLGQLVLSWGGEAMIGLQMRSNPQSSIIPENSAPDSTKSARN